MILHISKDEKFIDSTYKNFEMYSPGNNYLLVFSKSNNLNNIKIAKVDYIINSRFFSIRNILKKINKINKIDLIVCYSMSYFATRIIRHATCPVIWLGFGFDYYKLAKRPESLYEPKTLRIISSLNNLFDNFKFCFKSLAFRILPKHFYHYIFSDYHPFIPWLINQKKVTYFAPIIKPEYDMLKTALDTDSFPKYIDFNFGSGFASDETFFSNVNLCGNNILLGNSASPYNNHIEAIDIISEFINDPKRNILVPLSYGAGEKYINFVLSYGNNKLGSQFLPILNILEKREYFLKLSSCSIVVMNHLRQQALGNISIMLFLGSKVFLNEKNILFNFLKDCGFFIYSINDLYHLGSDALLNLTDTEIKHNRHTVRTLWSKNKIQNKVKNLLIQTGVGLMTND